MNPKGLVAAAPMTSQMSIFMRWASSAISFTSAMLTERKMFSRSLASSAASGVESRTTSSHTVRYSASARSPQAGVRPPTSLGVFRTV